jgi:2-phosphosulfolactate phosphatase
LEDTLCAGAIAHTLDKTNLFETNYDSTLASKSLYELAQKDILGFMENSSHFKRLEKLNLADDVKYCLSLDLAPVIPIMEGNYIIPHKS